MVATEKQSASADVPKLQTAQTTLIDKIEDALREHPWSEWALLSALCAVMLIQLFCSARQISQTQDEATHIYSGYRYLKCGDLTFSPEHPPLAKIVAAAPLVPMNTPVDCTPFQGVDFAQNVASYRWFYSTNWLPELSRARLAVSVFSVVLCVLVWVVSRHMFSIGAAIMATLLLIFEPNMLAYGGLVLTDVPVTAMLLFAVFGFYLWTQRPGVPRILLAGAAVGLTLLAKNSGIIVIPVLIILAFGDAFLYGRQGFSKLVIRNLKAIAFIFLIAYLFVWAGYGMRYGAHPGPTSAQEPSSYLPSSSAVGRVLITLEAKHLLPQSYLEGFASDSHSILKVVSSDPSSRFLTRLGALTKMYSVRCTVGLLAVFLLSFVGAAMSFTTHRREIVFLLLPVVLYILCFLNASWNGGMRHTLPILPLLLILSSAGCLELTKHWRWVSYVLPCLLVLHAGSSLRAFPNYLSYANEFWGGPAQYHKHLGGSYWQQSYWQARTYADQHPSENCWFICG